ncbi:MAG: hypothetical protein R6V06_07815 [Kiritimatiellia bacterium]
MRKFYILITLILTLNLQAQFSAELHKGDVAVRLSAEPQTIDPARDLMLTIKVACPTTMHVDLPDLQDRFQGFSMAEDFTSEPINSAGKTLITQQWKLTPEPAAERYRLAPFAVTVTDKSADKPHKFSFATKAVVFPKQEQRPPVTGEPEVTPEPEWIAPPARTVTLWIFAAIAGLFALAAIIYGLTRISVKVKELRMSPLERALAELDRLLERNLPDKGLFKDFYVELTMVVRRYIERAHKVRAPEQTTEEFLAAAGKHPDFTPEVLDRLKTFLESADLVKFAGQETDAGMAREATENARRYINSDAEALSSQAADRDRES